MKDDRKSPPFGSVPCTACKTTGRGKHLGGICLRCDGVGWIITPHPKEDKK